MRRGRRAIRRLLPPIVSVFAAGLCVVFSAASESVAVADASLPEASSGATSSGASSNAAGSNAATSSAPACDGVYEDVVTAAVSYAAWDHTLVDTIYMLPSTYYPPDLVSTGLAGGGAVRDLVRSDLTAMAAAASHAGAPIQVQSAFRSYATQASTFDYWVSVSGYQAALLSSARPGHSEHQLGTTIDFTSLGGAAPWDYADWATTPAGSWMKANAWRFGFVESYPKGVSPTPTCYAYEPWHFRFVGRTVAAAIESSGLTTREWFWEHPNGLSGTGSTGAPRFVTGTAVGNTTSGPFTAATKIQVVRGYITWRFDGGPALAGQTIEVWSARKTTPYGTWSSWHELTTRRANAEGVAYAIIHTNNVQWLSIRPVLGSTWGPSSIGRWVA